jgi:hypothetical protein
MIDKYIRNAAPSGNEINGQKMWLDYVRAFVDKSFTDVYGNAAGSLILTRSLHQTGFFTWKKGALIRVSRLPRKFASVPRGPVLYQGIFV